MPYVDNSGVKIHYHVEGDGPPLVLQHGLTNSLETWYAYGFVEELQKDYRLILVDARGHGRSGKPHDPADYDLKLRVSDILAVIDDVGVDKATPVTAAYRKRHNEFTGTIEKVTVEPN